LGQQRRRQGLHSFSAKVKMVNDFSKFCYDRGVAYCAMRSGFYVLVIITLFLSSWLVDSCQVNTKSVYLVTY